jgi:hypothetical protein
VDYPRHLGWYKGRLHPPQQPPGGDFDGPRTGLRGRRANQSIVRGSGVSSGTRPGHAATVRASGFPLWPPGVPSLGLASRLGAAALAGGSSTYKAAEQFRWQGMAKGTPAAAGARTQPMVCPGACRHEAAALPHAKQARHLEDRHFAAAVNWLRFFPRRRWDFRAGNPLTERSMCLDIGG